MVTESSHAIVNCWNQRSLQLGGRIHVLKFFIFSKFVSASSEQYITEDAVTETSEIRKDFIWRRKPPKLIIVRS